MPSCLVAEIDGTLVGLVHYIFHSHCWKTERVCYLQDLFTDEAARGRGVAEALIAEVYKAADAEGAPGVYWLTQDFNETAKRLYDRIAAKSPFVRYNRILRRYQAPRRDGRAPGGVRRALDLMGAVREDDTGCAIGDMPIGAAATLGLSAAPRAHATATVAAPGVEAAPSLPHRLQDAAGGAAGCFGHMPRARVERHVAHMDGAEPGADGAVPARETLARVPAGALEDGSVPGAAPARSEAQRRGTWARREAAGEPMPHAGRLPNLDLAPPPDAVCPTGPARDGPITEMAGDIVADPGGSFPAGRGIGLARRDTMARREDPAALDVMRVLGAVMDPAGILDPGQVLPEDRWSRRADDGVSRRQPVAP